VQKALNSVKFPVSVSPRYGRWSTADLRLTTGAAVPGYLDVLPGAATQQALTGNS
jgi:hypothetical protein